MEGPGVEANERVDGVCQISDDVMLADPYVWPLRGVAWEMGVTRKMNPQDPVPAVVFRIDDWAILLMGML